jgi:hypothetical protein
VAIKIPDFVKPYIWACSWAYLILVHSCMTIPTEWWPYQCMYSSVLIVTGYFLVCIWAWSWAVLDFDTYMSVFMSVLDYILCIYIWACSRVPWLWIYLKLLVNKYWSHYIWPKQGVLSAFYWAHHEKIVCIDQNVVWLVFLVHSVLFFGAKIFCPVGGASLN